VAEVGQLALADFVEVESIPCIIITNEGLGQSVKNDASVRTIPLHPDLIRLGLLNRVEALRKADEKRLFPNESPRVSQTSQVHGKWSYRRCL
jgi:hypothetical protein